MLTIRGQFSIFGSTFRLLDLKSFRRSDSTIALAGSSFSLVPVCFITNEVITDITQVIT